MQTDVSAVEPSQAAIAPTAQEIKRKIKPNPAYQTQKRLTETLKSKGPQVVEVFPGVFRWMSAEPYSGWIAYGSYGFSLYAGPYAKADAAPAQAFMTEETVTEEHAVERDPIMESADTEKAATVTLPKEQSHGREESVSVAEPFSLNEPTLGSALPAAETRQVTVGDSEAIPNGLIDTDNEKSCLHSAEAKEVTGAIFDEQPSKVQEVIQTPEAAQIGFDTDNRGRRHRKPIVLTPDEREVAVQVGIIDTRPESDTGFTGPSVLDAYSPVRNFVGKRPAPVSKNLLAKRVAEQNGRCKYCDRRFGGYVLVEGRLEALEAQADHFRPVADRRNDNPNNIVAACHVCNRLKSSRLFSSVAEVQEVLQAAWQERGWKTAPALVPFKAIISGLVGISIASLLPEQEKAWLN